MLQFLQGGESYCDGHSRRHFLKVGGLAIGGLTLPSLLRAEEAAGSKATGKSIINIYLGGGPGRSHFTRCPAWRRGVLVSGGSCVKWMRC